MNRPEKTSGMVVSIDIGTSWQDIGQCAQVKFSEPTKCPEVELRPDLSTRMEPIEFSGTWDDTPWPAFADAGRELTIVVSRRFLWWDVAYSRSIMTVRPAWDAPTRDIEGMVTYAVSMQSDGPAVVTIAPWWERALYRVAWLWSRA